MKATPTTTAVHRSKGLQEMAYEVLYRKLRPRTFDELEGQEHVRRALVHALDNDRLHHAYLFTGTRGVGKTTIARILARCLNCEQGVSSKPCGTCSACEAVLAGRFVDLIEVDAASRTKVEDTRELLENLQYAPVQGRYKVYLIDEVHMLSTSSFNALLKTLEEPPPWVVFLLATTEPKKLPVTVLSRCLQFALKSLAADRISAYLQDVLTTEKVEFDTAALTLIGRAARGSMRDALSLTDQAIVHGAGKLSRDSVAELLGTVDSNLLERLAHCLADEDLPGILALSGEMATLTVDYVSVLQELASLLHRVAIRQSTGRDDDELVESVADRWSPEMVQLYYQIVVMGGRDIALAPDERTGFEMTVLRLLTFAPVEGDGQIESSVRAAKPVNRSTRPPRAIGSSGAQHSRPDMAVGATNVEVNPQELEGPPLKGTVNTLDWHELVSALPVSGMTKQLAQHCVLKTVALPAIALTLQATQGGLLRDEHRELLESALSNVLEQRVQLSIELGEPATETPRQRQQRVDTARRAAALGSLRQDQRVQALMSRMGGVLDEDSVRPL